MWRRFPTERIPSISERWFSESENTTVSGSAARRVVSVSKFATYPLVKTSARGRRCQAASRASSSTWASLVPAMLREPPLPVPCRRVEAICASMTCGFWLIPR